VVVAFGGDGTVNAAASRGDHFGDFDSVQLSIEPRGLPTIFRGGLRSRPAT
jgi:diacylglycerol kinase family enzyme